MSYQSESSKYRHVFEKYCSGCGLDVGCQGEPAVPHAWGIDLPAFEFEAYNGGAAARGPIQLRGSATMIPAGTASLDFVISSHLLEDYEDWMPPLKEWVRVLKTGGKLIVLIPDRERWAAALRNGQPPNDAHRHEGRAGELSEYAERLGLRVIEDRLTDLSAEDYSILFVAQKL